MVGFPLKIYMNNTCLFYSYKPVLPALLSFCGKTQHVTHKLINRIVCISLQNNENENLWEDQSLMGVRASQHEAILKAYTVVIS